jgi:hypothetical protein
MDTDKIFITGYAKLPEGITATELYKVVAIGIVVDRKTSEILEADVTLTTKTGRKFVSELLVGHKLTDIEKIEKAIKNGYYGSARNAILMSIKKCYRKYMQIIDIKDKGDDV